jgi:hypothetical protein
MRNLPGPGLQSAPVGRTVHPCRGYARKARDEELTGTRITIRSCGVDGAPVQRIREESKG